MLKYEQFAEHLILMFLTHCEIHTSIDKNYATVDIRKNYVDRSSEHLNLEIFEQKI